LSLGLFAWMGCGGGGTTGHKENGGRSGAGDKPKGDREGAASDKVHGPSHERGQKLPPDARTEYPAPLTAPLSPHAGNELDIFFETTEEKNPQPVAFHLESFTAQCRTGEDELKELKFECAPPNERPRGEKPGTCSHFVARAPWMKPTDMLYVVARIKLNGEEVTIRWKDFNPRKYAHHDD